MFSEELPNLVNKGLGEDRREAHSAEYAKPSQVKHLLMSVSFVLQISPPWIFELLQELATLIVPASGVGWTSHW
jgi:hypothetical protein